MENFVSGWETGIALIIFNCLLFILVIVSLCVGLTAKVKKKEKDIMVNIGKTYFSTLAFIAFLAVWVGLTVFMVTSGFM